MWYTLNTCSSLTCCNCKSKHCYSIQGVQQSDLVKQLLGTTGVDELSCLLRELPVGVLYLTQDGLTEGGPENQGVLYCYPPPVQKNVLGCARGAFLTLQHLLPDLAPSPPVR